MDKNATFEDRQDAMNLIGQLKDMEERGEIDLGPDVNRPAPVQFCLRCGHEHGKIYLEPTEEEKKEYIKCILGGGEYEKKYVLYDGQLTLHFKTLSNKTSDILQECLSQIHSEDPVKRTTEALKVKLLFYLVGQNKAEYEVPSKFMTMEDMNEEMDKRFGNMSENLLAIIIQTYQEFFKLIQVLSAAGFDEGFYKGAGLA